MLTTGQTAALMLGLSRNRSLRILKLNQSCNFDSEDSQKNLALFVDRVGSNLDVFTTTQQTGELEVEVVQTPKTKDHNGYIVIMNIKNGQK